METWALLIRNLRGRGYAIAAEDMEAGMTFANIN